MAVVAAQTTRALLDRHPFDSLPAVQTQLRQVFLHTQRLFREPREELSLAQRAIVFWTRLAVHCAGELKRDKAQQVAAALTYHTLFSILPMLVLAFLIFQSFAGLESSAERFEKLVIDVLVPETLLDSESSTTTGAGTATRSDFNEARAVLRDRFASLFEQLRRLNLAGIGIVGALVFLYGATSLLHTIEKSFDSIYRAERKRRLRTRLPIYFTIITLGPLALVAGQVFGDRLLDRMASTSVTAGLATPLATLLSLLAIWTVVVTLFLTVPNTRVRWHSASTGALFSAVLLLLLQELIGIYVARGALTSLYGALALFPIVLLWMYLVWLVVLFGLEISYSLQHLDNRPLSQGKLPTPLPGDPRWLLPILTHVGVGFQAGRATSAEELSRACGLPRVVLGSFLSRLESAELIHRIERRGEDTTFTLARPPADIRLRGVLSLTQRPDHEPGTAWTYLDRLRSHEEQFDDDATLATLL